VVYESRFGSMVTRFSFLLAWLIQPDAIPLQGLERPIVANSFQATFFVLFCFTRLQFYSGMDWIDLAGYLGGGS
jgi:hypothetical protein